MNDVRRLAVAGVGEIQVEKSLFAILRLEDDFLAVRTPRNARDQQIGWLILERVDPANVTTRSADYTELNLWIRIAGFRIWRDLDILVIRNMVDDGELGNRILIEPQKSNRR